MRTEAGDVPPFGGPRPARRVSVRLVAYGLVASMALLLLVSAAWTTAAYLQISSAETQLRTRWLPAQDAAFSLEVGYVEEETGERGYLLADKRQFVDTFLRGERTAATMHARLRTIFRGSPTLQSRLDDVIVADRAWQQLATAQLAARRAGPLPEPQLAAMAVRGRQRFDALRRRLSALTAGTDARAEAELDRIAAARTAAKEATIAALALALAVAALAVPVLRRVLTRPLQGLLRRVQRVAAGDYDDEIPPSGPSELATIAEAVDRMRRSILSSTGELVAARHELTLRDERERIAADLHDLTIQHVFALGLSLSAAARRDPATSAALAPLIDDTDRIIRELREIIFDVSSGDTASLRAQVSDVVREHGLVLGFVPTLRFVGPVERVSQEISRELLAVLQEALSNVLRHAFASRADVTVAIDAGAGHVALTVSDDGQGLQRAWRPGRGTRNMEARAARLGGRVTASSRPGEGTTVEWSVPLPSGAR